MTSPTAARTAAAAGIASMSQHMVMGGGGGGGGGRAASHRPLPRPPSTSLASLSTCAAVGAHSLASTTTPTTGPAATTTATTLLPTHTATYPPHAPSPLPQQRWRHALEHPPRQRLPASLPPPPPQRGGEGTVRGRGMVRGVAAAMPRCTPQAPIYRIVITGGPCSGKSTSLTYLKAELEKLHYAVYCVPEVATLLMTGGVRLWMNDADTRSEVARIRAAQARLQAIRAYERALQTLDEFAPTTHASSQRRGRRWRAARQHSDGASGSLVGGKHAAGGGGGGGGGGGSDGSSRGSSGNNDGSDGVTYSGTLTHLSSLPAPGTAAGSGTSKTRYTWSEHKRGDDDGTTNTNSSGSHDKGAADSPASLSAFKRTIQRVVLQMMMMLEDSFYELAALRGLPSVLLFDRGTMDGRAYCSDEEWAAILQDMGCTNAELCEARYDAVVHLVTAAQGAEAHYTLENNATRRESVAEARAADAATRRAWREHFLVHIVDNSTDFPHKLQRAAQFIRKVIGVTMCKHRPPPLPPSSTTSSSSPSPRRVEAIDTAMVAPAAAAQASTASTAVVAAATTTVPVGGGRRSSSSSSSSSSSESGGSRHYASRSTAHNASGGDRRRDTKDVMARAPRLALQQLAYILTGIHHDGVCATQQLCASRASSVADVTAQTRQPHVGPAVATTTTTTTATAVSASTRRAEQPQTQPQQRQRQRRRDEREGQRRRRQGEGDSDDDEHDEQPRYAVVSVHRGASNDGSTLREVSVSLMNADAARCPTMPSPSPSQPPSSSSAFLPSTPLVSSRAERRHTLPPSAPTAHASHPATAEADATDRPGDGGVAAEKDSIGGGGDGDDVRSPSPAALPGSTAARAPDAAAQTMAVAVPRHATGVHGCCADVGGESVVQRVVVPLHSWHAGRRAGLQRYFIVTHVDRRALPRDAVRADVTMIVLKPRSAALRSDVLIRRVYNDACGSSGADSHHHHHHRRRRHGTSNLRSSSSSGSSTSSASIGSSSSSSGSGGSGGSRTSSNGRRACVLPAPSQPRRVLYFRRVEYARPLQRCIRAALDDDDDDDGKVEPSATPDGGGGGGGNTLHRSRERWEGCYRTRSIVTQPITRERFVHLAARYDATQPLIRNTVTRFVVGLQHMSLATFVQPADLRGITRLVGAADLTCEDIPPWIQVETTLSMTSSMVVL